MKRFVIGGRLVNVVYAEPDTACEACGMMTECRPYGPGGMLICFTCGDSPQYAQIATENIRRAFDGLPPKGERPQKH